MNFAPASIERLTGHNLTSTFVAGLAFVVDATPADGQEKVVHFYAPAGFYDITTRHAKTPLAGIVETYIDGVLIDAIDCYDAVGDIIATRVMANVPISDGEHQLTFKVNGKNALSGDYYSYQAWLHINPR